MRKMQRALISLTDKSGIEDFAMQLQDIGIEILQRTNDFDDDDSGQGQNENNTESGDSITGKTAFGGKPGTNNRHYQQHYYSGGYTLQQGEFTKTLLEGVEILIQSIGSIHLFYACLLS